MTKGINLGGDPDHCPDPGLPRVRSPKSGFTGLSKKTTDFDEILWRAGQLGVA